MRQRIFFNNRINLFDEHGHAGDEGQAHGDGYAPPMVYMCMNMRFSRNNSGMIVVVMIVIVPMEVYMFPILMAVKMVMGVTDDKNNRNHHNQGCRNLEGEILSPRRMTENITPIKGEEAKTIWLLVAPRFWAEVI